MNPAEYGFWIGFRKTPEKFIPRGWSLKRLRELASFKAGGRLGLTMADYVNEGTDAYSAEGLNGKANCAEFTGPAVIVSSIGARCGKCFYAGGQFTTLNNVQVIFPDSEQLNALFLWNVINGEHFWDRYATAQPFIRPSEIQKSWIPVPPINEQLAIVSVLGAIDRAIEVATIAISSARALGVTLINECLDYCRAHCPTVQLGSHIADGPSNGLYRPESDYGDSGTPIVRIDSFSNGTIVGLDKLRRVVVPTNIRARFEISAGDVVINRVNALSHVGKAAVVPSLTEPTLFESNMMRLRCSTDLLPDFLGLVLRSNVARKHWLARSKPAVNQVSINQKDVRNFIFPLPDPEKQRRIVELIATADELHEHSIEKLDELKRLKRSMMNDLLTGRVKLIPELFEEGVLA